MLKIAALGGKLGARERQAYLRRRTRSKKYRKNRITIQLTARSHCEDLWRCERPGIKLNSPMGDA